MDQISTEVRFFAFCVEIYKAAKSISGKEAYNYLHDTGAVDYIDNCREALHTTGHLYIVDSIDEYIKTHTENRRIQNRGTS
jgi:hypothetical protein